MASLDRLSEIGDLFKDAIELHLKNADEPCRVERVWFINVNRGKLQSWKDSNKNFTVYVVPVQYENETVSRSEDEDIYRYALVFVKTYTEQGNPTNEWVDGCVQIAAEVVRKFGEVREPITGQPDGPRAVSGKFLSLLETDLLLEEKLYWAEAEFEFREVVSA